MSNPIQKFLILFLGIFLISTINPTFADDDIDDDTVTEEEKNLTSEKRQRWNDAIKEQYELSDEDMQKLNDSGMNHSQKVKAAQLMSSSEKPLDDILKMRQEDKMGWGKIAKELGVHPGELGKGNKAVRERIREKRETRKADRQEKREKRMEKRKANREERKANRDERKSLRRERRQEKRSGGGKGRGKGK